MTIQEKKVVDEVSGWLRVFDDGSVDRTWVGPPEAKFMVDPVPAHEEFIDRVAVRDVSSNLGPQVRLYMPETQPEDDPNEKIPILVHFPGGGFCVSEANWFIYYAVYSKLAAMGRVIVVSVYLPHAPENKLPAAVDVGFSAILWLTALARSEVHDPWLTNRADFERVFLIGDSSGGSLVHEVGVLCGKNELSPLKLGGSIPIHPGVVRARRSKSELEMPETPFLTLEMVDKFLSLALPNGSSKDHPITCPMGPNAGPLSGVHIPPVMYCLADKDLFIDTQMEFYEALKEAGKEVELYVSKNMSHSFYLNKMAVEHDPETKEQTQKLFQCIVDFIKSH